MAAPKKSKKKAKKKTAKKTVGKAKARTAKAGIAKTKTAARGKKASPKKARGKTKAAKTKAVETKAVKSRPGQQRLADRSTPRPGWARSVPAETTEDFQGLSTTEQADSESVDELVEEGNVFEAGAVAGVQRADDEDEREVHTREFPEDDVPEEYLDKDE